MKERLRSKATELGFARVGFCRADGPLCDPSPLLDWLAEGRHGRMGYLERSGARRADPRYLLPDARSMMVVGVPYSPSADPAVAAYARLADYHREISERLTAILSLARELDPSVDGVVCVDTKPLLERAAARAAGVGWVGKSTLVLDESHGPWLMLGELILTADLPPDEPAKDRCGTCTRCLDACPTDAFVAPYVLDARRCISYWTIEHRGAIPVAFREAIGERIFGCDDCLTACPFGPPPRDQRGDEVLPVADELRDIGPDEVIRRLDEGFNRHFKHLAISRSGKAGLLRNCLTVLGNRGRRGDAATVHRYLDHDDAGVRAHAAWALGRIGDRDDIDRLRAALSRERDDVPRQDLEQAIAELSARE